DRRPKPMPELDSTTGLLAPTTLDAASIAPDLDAAAIASDLDASSIAPSDASAPDPAIAVASDPETAPPALALDEVEHFAGVYPFPRLELVHGRGAGVTDTRGRTYMDFVSGIAVNALGHASPAIARAVSRQVRSLAHVSNLFANPPAAYL